MKSQQVTTEWGVEVEAERERERAADYQSEIWSVGQKWKWRGSEMAER